MDSPIDYDAVSGRVQVSGDFTIFTVGELFPRVARALAEHPQASLDLAAISEFDTAGLQSLLLLRRMTGERGAQLKLSAASTAVRQVLELYHLGAWLAPSEV